MRLLKHLFHWLLLIFFPRFAKKWAWAAQHGYVKEVRL